MFSSLSMNRMASMPEMLEPMGRPSLWRKTWRGTCCLAGLERGLRRLVWRGGILGSEFYL